MITIGTRKRICIGGWILLALLLFGHNGFKLLSFLDPELPGQSRVVKVAREKWQQLEKKAPLAMTGSLDNINLDRIFANFSPVSHKQKKKVAITRPQSVKEKRIKIKLPDLTGIMQISDAHGGTQSLAVIDGECLGEGQRVLGFIVKEISKEGIILTRGGTSWFVPAPKISFSLDQGG
jgi:hypothetical protein